MLYSKKIASDEIYDLPTPFRAVTSSKHEIITALNSYLNRSNTEYAIMLDGSWGTGKTYFYKTEIKPLLKSHQSVYISLYGLKSIQDIEDEIFKVISLQNKGHQEGVKGIDAINQQILDNVKICGSGYAVQFFINQWKENLSESGIPFVLCLDDLERWEGSFSVCLSYINKLVEHESAKCILIGNLNVLEHEVQKGFENTRDKTIGHIYKFENNTDIVFKAALNLVTFKNNNTSQFIKNLINDNHKNLSDILNRVNYKNIRTVSEALQIYEEIYIHNATSMSLSKNLAFYYFCSLLATLILIKRYFVNYEMRDKLLNGYNASNQGYAFLSELGYFDEKSPDYITEESRFLLETIFYRADKIALTGLFSIVQKGFYFNKDFEHEFLKWSVDKSYEAYLDTSSLCHLEDKEVAKIIQDVLHSIFDKKEITNPATLLLLVEHLTGDIRQGVIDLDLDQTKNNFIELFSELYEKGLIEKTFIYDLDFHPNHFTHCRDVYDAVNKMNREYIKSIENHNLSIFWLEITNRPEDAIELFQKNKQEPVFSIYYNPEEVIEALNQLNNSQLFELIGWLGSRNNNPECDRVCVQESKQAIKIAQHIEYLYQNKFGMKAGHFKKIAKLLAASGKRYRQD